MALWEIYRPLTTRKHWLVATQGEITRVNGLEEIYDVDLQIVLLCLHVF